MNDGWPEAKHPVESADGRDGNPPVQDFFRGFTNRALGQLKLWLEQEFDLRNSTTSVPSGGKFEIKVFSDTTVITTGDGAFIFAVPYDLNGKVLSSAHAFVTTVSSSGLPTVQIRNVTGAVDMLSTRITIDVSEFTSYTAATQPVIDTANDNVATGDRIAVDVDVAGTGAKGLGVILVFS